MVRKSFGVLIILFVFSRIGLAQISISIDAQKDIFYNQLSSPEEGHLTISHSDFLPFSGHKPTGDTDLSAQIWMAWDSTYFYFYAEVQDDIIRVNNNAGTLNDCLELKFDPDPSKKPPSVVVNVRLTALDSTEANNIHGVDNLNPEVIIQNIDPAANSPANYARRRTDDGYVLELRLAWKWIKSGDDRNVHVGIGNIFGLAINFHDNDSEQRDKSIQWSAGMADEVWTTPELLGSVEFLPDHKLKLIKRNAIDPTARPGTTYISSARFAWVPGSVIMLENWKYHPGDDSSWADPVFDDSEWETTTTLLNQNNLPESGWNGIGWFRIHIVVDSTLINKALGLSIMQAGVSQLYLDGTLIYTFGEHSDDWTGLPKVLTFAGKKRHVIAVRYSNLFVKKFHSAGFISGFYLRLGNINQMAEDTIRRETFIGFQMFFTSLPLAIGLLHLILFTFFPGLRQNLFFALFLFSYAATIYFDYQILLSTDIGQQLLSYRMHCAMLPFWVLLQLRFVYSLFYMKLPKQFWIISLVAFGLGAAVFYKPVENFDYFGIVHMLITIEIIRVIVLAFIKKKEGAWIIGMAFLVFFLFGFLDILMDAGILVSLREMENPYALGSIGFFIAMSIYLSREFARTNKKLAEQKIEQKLLETENIRQSKELEEARQLQLSMLPKELPQLPHFEIGVFMKTATEVGGDYYDFHLADNGTLTIAIGDATGHGMKAGTMVASMKSLFGTYDESADIPQFFNKCSTSIKRMKLGNLYMAMMLVRISGHKMIASAAGMPPILIHRTETGIVEEIVIKGMPLGGPSGFLYQKRKTELTPGDTILLMSDGFPELFNDKDEMLDYPRVKEIFKEMADRSADEIIAHLNEAGERWRNGKPQDDDITFVVLKVKHDRDR